MKVYGGKKGWSKALLLDLLMYSSIVEADFMEDQKKDCEHNNDAWNSGQFMHAQKVLLTSAPY